MAKTNTGKKPISQEEYVTNKVLTVFSVCLLGVLVLMILQRLLDIGSTWRIGMMVQKALLIVGAVGVLWSLYLFWRERSGKRSGANRIVCGRNVLLVSVLLVLIMTAIGYLGTMPIKALYVILPALAVYYLVYHSYAPEFFVIALDCGLAAGMIWAVRRLQVSANHAQLVYAVLAAAAVLLVIQLIAVSAVRGKKGVLTFAGRKADLHLSRNAYVMLTATPVLMAVLVAAAVFLGRYGLICMGIAAAYLFITAVYYTVKLM